MAQGDKNPPTPTPPAQRTPPVLPPPGSHGSGNSTHPLLELTTQIVTAHIASNAVATSELPSLIASVHKALSGISITDVAADSVVDNPKPAVSIRTSVQQDHIVCLEDGQKMKVLTRHLKSSHGLDPKGYRAKWSLPADYPMVAPAFAEHRRKIAKEIGLGKKPLQRNLKPGTSQGRGSKPGK